MKGHKASDLTLVVGTRYTEHFTKRIQAQFPELKIIACAKDEEFAAAAPEADVLFLRYNLPRGSLLKGLLKDALKLKWIQITEAGADTLIPVLSDLKQKVEVTCMRGTHGDIMSEYIICVILMLLRNFPRYLKNQERKIWEQDRADSLRGKTVLILGLGQIGKVLARRIKAFDARVIGLEKEEARVDHVDLQVPPSKLMEVLPEADVVCTTLPLTPETRNFIQEKQFRAMKKTAFFINTARGAIVDEGALIRALKEKWIAGAAIDAFTTEPLPPESELWNLPNLILTPHISGAITEEEYVQRRLEIFSENLHRFISGKELINLVDSSRGF